MTKQEADCQPVTAVWKGGSKSKFESVLAALQRAEIPLLFREHINARSAVRASLFSLFTFRENKTTDTEFEIKVLGHDADRASQAIEHAVAETEDG